LFHRSLEGVQSGSAMTDEGICLTNMKLAQVIGDGGAVDFWNERLMECTHRYEVLMHCLGEASTNMWLSNFTQI
jgi:hypothetical protein